ncbi:hypothetical protein Bca4012_044360 [Brassica carinata]|uniref:Uncharacterized protein n=3 Tax=Brassica TaxID=3705 RepID=A0A0D3EA24_BRAOL|nr:hypothetical protein HID58_087394 [Brassica napus]CAF1753341.1 unnamed protein product [Brassica napus]VDD31637.1 unnamed protein product [Brassica oleracea]
MLSLPQLWFTTLLLMIFVIDVWVVLLCINTLHARQGNLMVSNQSECFFEGLLSADAITLTFRLERLKLLSDEEKDLHSVTTKRFGRRNQSPSPK